jgi:hypothetical protein
VSGLRLGGPAEATDLAAFLGRCVSLDPAAVARVRSAGSRVTAYVRLPFGVLVSRTVAGAASPDDVTVRAADLLSALDPSAPGALPAAGSPAASGAASAASGASAASAASGASAAWVVAWPGRRDAEWRAALPPGEGWQLLDSVPGDVVRGLVRAGREALRAVPSGVAAAAGESLLDHESLTVSGAGRTAVLPLRVLSALTRMGFLGEPPEPVAVSATGGWTRLAATYGSAYHHTVSGLSLAPR